MPLKLLFPQFSKEFSIPTNVQQLLQELLQETLFAKHSKEKQQQHHKQQNCEAKKQHNKQPPILKKKLNNNTKNMGRRRLLPNINNLLLQLHLKSNTNCNSNGVDHHDQDHLDQDDHHHLHIFTWPYHRKRTKFDPINEDQDDPLDRDETRSTEYTEKSSFTLSSSTTTRVSFGTSSVRTYTQVLGDHPYCSEGCPIQLGWTYVQEDFVHIDQYGNSDSISNSCDLRLTPEERRKILISSKQQKYVHAMEVASIDENSSDDEQQQHQQNCQRELSRECRRLNRCAGFDVKANKKRNRKTQAAFFGTHNNMAATTVST